MLPDTYKLKSFVGARLVVQWLRICLPMQGAWVQSQLWEDPTCLGAATEAHVPGACAPQQEKPLQQEAGRPYLE